MRQILKGIHDQNIASYIWSGLLIGWVLATLITGARAQAWVCPRCGDRFASKWWYHRSILLARKCAHCGL